MISGRAYRRGQRHQRLQRLASQIDNIIDRHAPSLLKEIPDAELSSDGLLAILTDLEAEIPVERIKRCRMILRSRLQQLQTSTCGQVNLPSPETFIRRDPSPFAGRKLANVVQLEKMLALFKEEISTGLDIRAGLIALKKRKGEPGELALQRKNDRYQRALLGRLIFSSIVNGGLLSRPLVSDLLSALQSNLMANEGIAWVSFDLRSTANGKLSTDGLSEVDPDGPVRRWFPDPVTLGLIRHWISNYKNTELRDWARKESPAACLKTYIGCLRRLRPDGQRSHAIPDSVEWLRTAARTRLSLQLPQVLVNFLGSLDAGSSMAERSWWRYQFDLHLTQKQESRLEDFTIRNAPADETPEINDAENFTSQRSKSSQAATQIPDHADKKYFERQDRLVGELRGCLSHPTGAQKYATTSLAKQNIKGLLSTYGHEMAPILVAIAKWALWRLDKHPHDEDIRPASVTRYLSRIARPLVAYGIELNLDDERVEVWEDFYADAMDSIESATDRAKSSEHLRSFHRFIMENRSAPPCSIAGESVARSHGRISVISDKDYLRTLKALSRTGSSQFLRDTALIIVILMYRVGLRPEEIISMQFSHIQGVTQLEIKKRKGSPIIYLKTSYRQSLKTPSSLRQIPLASFLDHSELERFLTYLSRRLHAVRGQDLSTIPVFGNGFSSTRRLSTNAVFSHISAVLKRVTSDQNVIPYTLRHSCFTQHFFRIVSAKSLGENTDSPFLRSGHTPREATYSISTLGGHLDPDVTLGTYIHTQDICAFYWIKDLNSDLPLGTWAHLEGKQYVTLTTRRRRRKEEGGNPNAIPAWDDLLKSATAALDIRAPSSHRGNRVKIIDEPLDERSIVYLSLREAHVLLMSLNRSMSNSSRGAIFEVPEKEIKVLLARASSVQNRVSGFREAQKSESGAVQHESFKKAQPRLIKKNLPWVRLPPIHTGAQPGALGPGLPTQKQEIAEAQRIFQLLCGQARENRESPNFIITNILTPIQIFHDHLYRTGASVRMTDEQAFSTFFGLLQRIRIPGERIEISLISVPKQHIHNIADWEKRLRKIARSRSVQFRRRHQRLACSSKYPEFGSVSIRVLAPPDDCASSKADTTRDRSGSGWRVGLTYAGLFISSALSAGVFLRRHTS